MRRDILRLFSLTYPFTFWALSARALGFVCSGVYARREPHDQGGRSNFDLPPANHLDSHLDDLQKTKTKEMPRLRNLYHYTLPRRDLRLASSDFWGLCLDVLPHDSYLPVTIHNLLSEGCESYLPTYLPIYTQCVLHMLHLCLLQALSCTQME